MKALQKDSIAVVRGDWKVHIGAELQLGICAYCLYYIGRYIIRFHVD